MPFWARHALGSSGDGSVADDDDECTINETADEGDAGAEGNASNEALNHLDEVGFVDPAQETHN